jgi:ketosteroid isomerase-like protein
MQKILLAAALLFGAVALQAQTTPPKKDVAAIKSARAASNKAIANHNVPGIVEHFMPDYIIVTGRGKRVTGKDTVAAFWKQSFADMPGVVYVRTPLNITISKNDTLAWETGKWTAIHSYSGGGNYSAQWHKTNGVWQTQAELFVSLEK